MHFLLTNDDGFDAIGLRTLARLAGRFGRVSVVASQDEHSGRGHAVTYKQPLTAWREPADWVDELWVCDGTPADCVRLGVTHLLDGPVDAVLAGINHGANAGVDVFYSGTFAAAREASILGLPALAVSQFIRRGTENDWRQSEAAALRALEHLLPERMSNDVIWSVNLPATGGDRPALRRATLSYDPLPTAYERSDDGSGRSVFTYNGVYADRVAAEGSDVAIVFAGDVAMTPIRARVDAGAGHG